MMDEMPTDGPGWRQAAQETYKAPQRDPRDPLVLDQWRWIYQEVAWSLVSAADVLRERALWECRGNYAEPEALLDAIEGAKRRLEWPAKRLRELIEKLEKKP